MFLKGYLIKEIENIFSVFLYRVIETLVEVWEKLEIAWKHSHFVLVFPRISRFSQTSTRIKHGRGNGYGAPDLCVMQVPPPPPHIFVFVRI